MTQAQSSPEPTRQRILPHLSVRGGAEAIDFYVRAFGAVEVMRLKEPSGKIGHAELTILGARFMLADEYPDWGSVGPATLGGTSVTLSVYVDAPGDVDALAARAVEAGAKLLRPIADQFYGERVAALEDPFGHKWSLHGTLAEVSTEAMQASFDKMLAG